MKRERRDLMDARFFHFSYLGTQKQEKPRLHALRDGDAFAELAAALYEQHGKYGGLILNFPVSDDNPGPPTLGLSDLLVLTTRPPLNDDDFDRKYIKRSGTELEKSILQTVGLYFSVCRRSYVKLSEDMAAKLKYANRGEIQFSMYAGAYYKRHRTPYTRSRELHKWEKPAKSTVTAAFALLTRLWDGGPRLLSAFGMDGVSTLIWCYLLRTVHPNLLDLETPRFVMAEMIASPLPEAPPTLSFAKDWRIDILLDHRLK
jgi:hypothetical protein